jgi:hypothetical protein
MSRAMMFGSPITLPRMIAPSTPLTGPDSTIVIGLRLAACIVATPPFDCIM